MSDYADPAGLCRALMGPYIIYAAWHFLLDAVTVMTFSLVTLRL